MTLGTVVKYDPAEPRDEAGRWTAGDLAAAFPSAKITLGVPANDKGRANHAEVVDGLLFMAKKFPGTARDLAGITGTDPQNVIARAGRGARAYFDHQLGTINFNPETLSGRADPYVVESSWLVDQSWRGTAIHEFAHLLMALNPQVDAIANDIYVRASLDPSRAPSAYAMRGANPKNEFWAESVTEALTKPYEQWHEGTEQVMGMLNNLSLKEGGLVLRVDKGAWNEEDHPRVPAGSPDGGQFTSGGEQVAAAREAILKEWRDKKLTVAKIGDEVFARTGAVVATYGRYVDKTAFMRGMAQFVALHERFRGTLRPDGLPIRDITFVPLGRTVLGRANYYGEASSIELGQHFWSQPDLRQSFSTATSGYHASGTYTPEGFMAHEFAHCLEDASHYGSNTIYPGTDLGWRQNEFGKLPPICGYGRTSPTENLAEYFASAYGYSPKLPNIEYITAAPQQVTGDLAKSLDAWAMATVNVQTPDQIPEWARRSTKEPALYKVAGSPLTFTSRAVQLLHAAAKDAWQAGYDSFNEEFDPDDTLEGETDDLEPDAEAAAADAGTDWSGFLTGLAALLIGGKLTEAALGNRLDNYTSGLYALFNEGFGEGAIGTRRAGTVTWVAAGDAGECDVCDARDGMTWDINDAYPYPGSGRFGSEICRGGPRCRCELQYAIEDVPDDTGGDPTYDDLGEADLGLVATIDLTQFTVDELASLKALLRKYSEDEPRDEHGRWTADGDPGPKPDYKDYGGFSNEYYTARHAWDAQVGRLVAIGAMPPDEAQQRGWDAPSGRPVQPLPPVLYHATTALTPVLQDGLKTRDELGGKSALGGGADDTISFTTDRALADRIAEVMVEAHDVATGSITNADLMQRAVDGGFDDKMLKILNGPEAWDRFGVREQYFDHTSPMLRSLDEQNARVGDLGWHPEPGATPFVGGDGVTRYAQWERPMTDTEKDDYRLSQVYRGFLVAQEWNGGPSDPSIWYPSVDFFKNLDPKDIGVVEAKPIPGAMGYQMGGMAEWRTWSGDAVTVSAVKYARPGLVKFDPAQPRDDHGRWTDEEHSDDEAILALGDDPVRWAARDWSGGGFSEHESQAMRAAIATGQGSPSQKEHAAILLQAVKDSKPTTYPLWRGLGMRSAGDYAALRKAFEPGAQIDLNLSSWTKAESVARQFASGMQGTVSGVTPMQGFSNYQVMLRLEPGAHAYDATNDIVQGPQYTEHLTGGRFEVAEVQHQPWQPAPWYPENWGAQDIITLRQVGTLDPAGLVGSKIAA